MRDPEYATKEELRQEDEEQREQEKLEKAWDNYCDGKATFSQMSLLRFHGRVK